ncbi:MAG: methyltransferase domain-containing protein [Hyphomonadaceae bacterium]
MVHSGCQSIYSAQGAELFPGQWDPRALYRAVTGEDGAYWRGRRVLDIGANTSGLSVEIARHGASVCAAEPDPYRNSKAIARDTLESVIADERLELELVDDGLFQVSRLGRFDTVLCLGLVYHFRDPQYVLDYLSTLDMADLIISEQTYAGDELVLVNRKDARVLPAAFWDNHKEPISGWHPTRALFERMLEAAGFGDVTPLTDPSVNFPAKPAPGLTNAAYYRARKIRSVDPIEARERYLPR